MTNDHSFDTDTRAEALKSQLAEEQLNLVSGGVVAPRDAASGLATGRRTH
jgi:hypothetical protein